MARIVQSVEEVVLLPQDIAPRLQQLRLEKEGILSQKSQLKAAMYNLPKRTDPEEWLALIVDFPTIYANATDSERKLLIRSLIKRVVIKPDHSIAIEWQE